MTKEEKSPLLKGKKRKKVEAASTTPPPITRAKLDAKVAGAISGSIVTVSVAELGVDSDEKLWKIESYVKDFYAKVVRRETARVLIGATSARMAVDNWAYTPQMDQLVMGVNATFNTHLSCVHVWQLMLSDRKDGGHLVLQCDVNREPGVIDAALQMAREIAAKAKTLYAQRAIPTIPEDVKI